MPWQDRIKPAAYTAPDGTRILFTFEDVGKTIAKKTTAHDFPDANVTYVRDHGIRGRRYPLRVIFTGESHDIEADTFENMLVQPGPGILEHPLYGEKQVVPFGEIHRRDALKTAANQTVFEITFYESVLAIYPSAGEDTSGAVDVAVESLSFGQFAASIDLGTAIEKANFLATLKALLAGIKKGMKAAQNGVAKLQNGMNKIDKALNAAIDLAVADPLTMAFQLKTLMGAPARSLALLKDRLKAYGDLARSIFSGKGTGSGGGTGASERGDGVVNPGIIVPGASGTEANAFHTNDLVAQLCVVGQALAVSGEQFTTKSEAIEAAEELLALYGEQVAWSEANFDALATASSGVNPADPIGSGPSSIDTGEAAEQLRTIVVATCRHLIASSYTLPPSRLHTVTRPRTPIDLCFELYGEIDSLDSFLAANDFAVDEVLEIPAGRVVIYHA